MVCAKIISAWLTQVQRKHVSRHSKLNGILPLKLRQRVSKQRHRTVMVSHWLADIVMKRYVRYWAYCFNWKTLKAKYPRDTLTAVVTYHYSRTVFLPNRRRRVDAILQLNFHCHFHWHGILCLERSVHTSLEAECSLNLIISFGQSVFVFPVKYHNYVSIFQDCTSRAEFGQHKLNLLSTFVSDIFAIKY